MEGGLGVLEGGGLEAGEIGKGGLVGRGHWAPEGRGAQLKPNGNI